MKTSSRQHSCSPRRGSAMIVVLALIIVVGAILMTNSRSLNDLKRNLRRIEQKQLVKFGVSTTNVVTITNKIGRPLKP